MPEYVKQLFNKLSDFFLTSWSDVSDLFVTVWQSGLFGISMTRLLIAFSTIVFAYLIRGLFACFIINLLKSGSRKTFFTLDDLIVKIITPPLKLFPIIMGVYIAIEIMQPVDKLQIIAERSLRSIMVYAIFVGLLGLIDPVIDHSKQVTQKVKAPIRVLLKRSFKVFLVLTGLGIILEIWGIRIITLLAGFGIIGAALALAAQDLIKNLISGLLIIIEKRFLPGEWIKVDNVVEGVVEDIHFRSTRIRRFDRAPVFVPNSKLSDNVMTNFSRMTHRRIYWLIGVEYASSTQQLHMIRDRILEYIMNHDAFAKPPEVATFVRINRFSPSSIDFMLYCFTKTTNWGEWLEIKEALAVRIKEIIENEAKTALALPSIKLYQDEGIEVYTPPENTQIQA